MRCRFSEVQQLHQKIIAVAPPSIKAKIPHLTKTFSLIPSLHETRPEFLKQRHREVIAYLQTLANSKQLWAMRIVKEFFEVGSKSFDPDLGKKGKEGSVYVSSGGLVGFFTSFRPRWLMLRDGFIAWFEDSASVEPRGVIVIDANLRVEASTRSVMGAGEFVIRSDKKVLYVQVGGRDPAQRVSDWLDAFRDMIASRPRAARNSQGMTTTHSFNSFSPLRSNCPASWYVCGRAYLGAVATALRSARRQIFIADWRMNPSVLLTRYPDPPVVLKDLLFQKALEGVEVYVMLYKEASEMLQKKHRTNAIMQELMALHPNIQVVRHGSGAELFWSHHDKIVVVDQVVGFVGGIDLVEGRFDDFLHRVGDIDQSASPFQPEALQSEQCFFPGDEYYQPNAPKKPKATATRGSSAVVANDLNATSEMDNLEDEADTEYFMTPATATAVASPTTDYEFYDDDYLEDMKKGALCSAPPTRKGTDDEADVGETFVGVGNENTNFGGAGGGLVVSQPDPIRSTPSPKASAPSPSLDVPINLTFELSAPLGMRVGPSCVVEAIYPEGQAEALSMKEGCVILSVENDPVNKLSEIMSIINDFKACGMESVTLSVMYPQVGMVSAVTAVEGQPAERRLNGPNREGIDRDVIPRMPWQDMAVGVGGCAARDVALHFIVRWNHHRTAAMSDNPAVHFPILLPFSDNLDTDYKSGWPSFTAQSASAPNVNSHIPSPLTAQNREGEGRKSSQDIRSGQSVSSRYVLAGLGQEAEKILAEEERLMALFSMSMTTAKLQSLGSLPMPVPGAATSECCNIQILRSVGPWSLGVSTENSIQLAWIDAINHSEHFIYIEQQYFITNMDPPGVQVGEASHVKHSAESQGVRSSASVVSKEPSKFQPEQMVNHMRGKVPEPNSECQLLRTRFVATVPPGHKPGDIFHVKTSDPITGVASTSSVTVPHGMGPGARLVIEVDPPKLSAQPPMPPPTPQRDTDQPSNTPTRNGARRGSSDTANASIISSVVEKMENIVVGGANVVMKGIQERLEGKVQNRIGHALHQRLRRAIMKNIELQKRGQRKVPFRVLVVIPLHPNGRFLHSTECMAVMNAQFNCIGRGDRSLLGRLAIEFPDIDLTDYILFTSLRAHGELTSGLPVSEQVYVHSKCLIVDDRVAIVGSSNLNDRSMCGDRDSEIAVKITETLHCTPSQMDGDHFAAAEFAHTLRVKVWREHLGMIPLGDPMQLEYAEKFADTSQRAELRDGGGVKWWDDDLSDPICTHVWDLIRQTATNNTTVLEQAFDERPWNDMTHLPLARNGLGLSRRSAAVATEDASLADTLAQKEEASRLKMEGGGEGGGADGEVKKSGLKLRSVESVRKVLSDGNVRGRLVLFPHQFLHQEDLEPDIATRLLIGKNLFL